MRAFMLAALLLGGCAAGATGGRLVGDWQAVDINGVPVSGGRAITLRLGPDRRASGSSGCNSYSSDYRLMSRQGIEFGPVAVTKMACEPAVMEQEGRYLSILRTAQGYSFYSDGGVSLIAPDGRAVRFRRP